MNFQKLREIVEAFGPVESVTIIKNHQTQKSRGCGFVKYVYREDAMDSFMVRIYIYRFGKVEFDLNNLLLGFEVATSQMGG